MNLDNPALISSDQILRPSSQVRGATQQSQHRKTVMWLWEIWRRCEGMSPN